MYPALQRAFLALTEADADRRHVILLTDGVPSPGDFEGIARRMAEAGITVSTVSISAGADQMILKDLSKIAGGRHIHCESADELTQRLVAEARSAAEEKRDRYPLFVYRTLPGLDLGSAPPLAGYAMTSPKSGAELLLMAGAGDPLLAWRRYGEGAVVAFASTLDGEWTEDWRAWDGYGGFWSRIGRLAERKLQPADYSVSVERNDGTAQITLDVVQHDGTFLNDADARVNSQFTPLGTDGEPRQLVSGARMGQVAPGRYGLEVPSTELGVYELGVAWQDSASRTRRAKGSFVVDYPDELLLRPTDAELLRNVSTATDGIYPAAPDDVFAARSRSVPRVTPLWRAMLLAVVLLFVLEVVVRRF
jgi:hypothetical protein